MVAGGLRSLIIERIRAHGPMPFAEFMDLALYHPALGYYARASVRSGRAGDFFTSVDVGPIFGELLARQFAEMWRLLKDSSAHLDLVEAAAGSGRLSRDILDAAARSDPAFYEAISLHLVEPSGAARARQNEVLGPHACRLHSSTQALPDRVSGVIFANELLDALPCHAVVMTTEGLREIFVDVAGGRLVETDGPLSSAAITRHLDRAGAVLEPGWRAEVNLESMRWVSDAAHRLSRGFLLLIDYGYEAAELYSAAHAAGTRTRFRHHVARDASSSLPSPAPWLDDPGEADITAHVDLTAVTRAANEAGLTTLGRLDQTYFLLGLGLADLIAPQKGDGPSPAAQLRRRLTAKTLLLPGGLGSTHKVLIFGKGVGAPELQGCSYRQRLT